MQRQRWWGDGRWGGDMVGWSVKVLKHAWGNGWGERKHHSPTCWVIRSGVPCLEERDDWTAKFFYLFFIQPLVRRRCFQVKAHTHREWKQWREIVLLFFFFNKKMPFIWSRGGGFGEKITMGRGRNIPRLEWKKAAKQASCCFHLPQHVYVCEW